MLLKDRLTYQASTNRLLPYKFRSRVLRGVISGYTRYQSRLSLAPETRKQINQEFIGEIEQLSELLERDLGHWYQG